MGIARSKRDVYAHLEKAGCRRQRWLNSHETRTLVFWVNGGVNLNRLNGDVCWKGIIQRSEVIPYGFYPLDFLEN